MQITHNLKYLLDRRRGLRDGQTKAEEKMWQILRNRNVLGFKFNRQYSIGRFILDFYCSAIKLGIELDGSIHDLPEQQERDAERERLLVTNGVHFLRFTNDDVLHRTDAVMSSIRGTLRSFSEREGGRRPDE